ncbi:MAG TPA: SH3 domain-containing protein [Saprospiraceae bacterium]|nr:SH3 domain-containing protein [Saprospiraceae bacterium]HMP24143.1 SH3 domain-containing protein [Saprospiraceae bacterium]
MRIILYILPLALMLLWTACKQRPPADTDAENNIRPLNRDSIRQIYEATIAQKPALLPPAQIIEPGRLRPVDEAPSDTIFFVYREALLQAIAQKDEFRLLAMTDGKIRSNPKETGGSLATFVEHWQLGKDKDESAIWARLRQVLQGGGVFSADRNTFTAPYYCATLPAVYDAEVFGVITGEGVRLRATPDLQGQVLKTISYDVVQILETNATTATVSGETHPWVKVKLADGKEGYIYGKFVGSPLDYRAVFRRQPNGSWLMTDFYKL